jgi:sugar phosphate isomerase/epimerase
LKGVLKRVKKIIEYGNLLHHTHIAENNGRFVPGVNNEDFTAYFKALKKINYCDRMSVECIWKNSAEQAAPALQAMRSQLAKI